MFDIPPLIPKGLTIDVAGVFEDLYPDSLRDFLRKLVRLLSPFLPDPPDVF